MPDPVTGIIGATVAGGAANIIGSRSAANKMSGAMMDANQLAQMRWQDSLALFKEMFGKGEKALTPYIEMGEASANRLTSQMPDFTAPIVMDQETLEKTPGYEFLMKQGMRGVTNQNVLRGLSGAQLKGAADFVKGLADTTYKTQFDIANVNKTNAFNRLFQTAEAGRGAGTSLLTAGVFGAGTMAGAGNVNAAIQGSNIMAAGQAAGGADIATGRAVGDMVTSLPYAPYVANKLYPDGKFAAATGMYGDDAQVPIGQSRA